MRARSILFASVTALGASVALVMATPADGDGGDGRAAPAEQAPAKAPAAPTVKPMIVEVAPPAVDEPTQDPEAVAALGRMVAYLRKLEAFEVTAKTTTDDVIEEDLSVQRNATATVTVRRPDHLVATITREVDLFRVYLDGKSATVYDPAARTFARQASPRGLGKAIQEAAAEYGIDLPIGELIMESSPRRLLGGALEITHLGTSRISGIECDHIVVRERLADWQVWIARGDTPLPRRYVYTWRANEARPQFTAELVWDISPEIPEGAFLFAPPEGIAEIGFGAAGLAEAAEKAEAKAAAEAAPAAKPGADDAPRAPAPEADDAPPAPAPEADDAPRAPAPAPEADDAPRAPNTQDLVKIEQEARPAP